MMTAKNVVGGVESWIRGCGVNGGGSGGRTDGLGCSGGGGGGVYIGDSGNGFSINNN